MGTLIKGYRGVMLCPKFDTNGIDNNYKLPNLRNVVHANFGNVQQTTGIMYEYSRTYDSDGNVTAFIESPIDCYIVSALTNDDAMKTQLASYADTFTNALGVVCTVYMEEISYSVGVAS